MTDEENKAEKPAEEQEKEEPEEEPAEADSSDLISRANAAAARLEAGNKELARLIGLQQKAQVEKTLSGTATAGVRGKTKDEKDIENAKQFLKGTGMDEELFTDQ